MNGSADLREGDSLKQYTHIKMLLEDLWKQSIQAMSSGQALTTDPPNIDVDAALTKMGFKFKSENIELDGVYFKKFKNNVLEVIWHHNDETIEYVWGQKDKQTGDMKIVEHWTLKVPESLGKLQSVFDKDVVSYKGVKKAKKHLAGTEDMPCSGTDYKAWGKTVTPAIGKDKGMGLHPTEEETLKKMDWEPTKTPLGIVYCPFGTVMDGEAMIFLPSGKVNYYSKFMDASGAAGVNVTQTWDDPEDAIRWLWKNYKLEQHHGGKSVKLQGEQLDEVTKLGFVEEMVNGHYNYEKPNIATVTFWANGYAWVWDLTEKEAKKAAEEPNPPIYKGTHQEVISYLHMMYGKKKTGEMPFSGKNYKTTPKTSSSCHFLGTAG